MNLREIDKLVAEKVMGWVAGGNGYWHDPARGPADASFVGSTRWTIYGPDGDGEFVNFRPSEDIAAAWEVVEAFPCEDVFLGSAHDVQSNRWQWCVSFNNPEDIAYADTMPLAICLAALKAKGVEVEG